MKLVPILALMVGALALSARADTKVSDPQIAALVVVANQVDIDVGKLAGDKSSNTDVKQFAGTMVWDHSSASVRFHSG